MDNEEWAKAYTELACVLAIMPKEFTEQIPTSAKNAIKSQYDEKYAIKFENLDSIKKHNFSPKMKSLLAVLKFNCWSNDDEKNKLLALFESNDTEAND